MASVDIPPPDADGNAVGAAVVLELPGLLSFRVSPLVLRALERLVTTPGIILADGQSLVHPRRFVLACHLGLLTDMPTIGCAKSILRGRSSETLPTGVGSHVPLVDKGDVVGAAVRTREPVSPIYVSTGHEVSLESAVSWALSCCKGYRMPEPDPTGAPGGRG